ncbi:MAG: beta-lactamase family protein [Candidatus Eremiobacteraeota bacterium]|nr:beta-lactamase family protein [Candidatus Eremiobacteraeota bacterium]
MTISNRTAPRASRSVSCSRAASFSRAYGDARVSPPIAATPQTIYKIGSVTKQFVAGAIMLLVQEHQLSLSDPVSKYVVSAASGARVTIANLLNQTAGYVDYYPLEYVDTEMQRATTADAIIAEYATKPLDFEPGSKYSYSNTNYTLLGKVIETVAHQPFESFLAKRFFVPLGMIDTSCESKALESKQIAVGYTTQFLSSLTVAAPEAPGWVGAAGCLMSTPADLLKWDAALMNGNVVDTASVKAMTTPPTLSNGTVSDYGYGLVTGTWHGHRYWAHDGGVSGFYALNFVFPDDRVAVAITYNTDSATAASLASRIFHEMFNVPEAATPHSVPPASVSKEDADSAASVRAFLIALQRNTVDRSALSADYNAFLTPALQREASERLSKLGEPLSVVAHRELNHGLESTQATVRFASVTVNVLMRTDSEGKIAEFLVQR